MNKIIVKYNSPVHTKERTAIRLEIDNSYGYVTDAEALFNRFGQKPGEERICKLQYSEFASNNKISVFETEISFDSPGYRSFVIHLKIDGNPKCIKYDDQSAEAILLDIDDKANYSFWEMFVSYSFFKTPDSIKGGIMYQIFLDTFCSKDLSEEAKQKIVSWNHDVKWKPDKDGHFRNNQFYGGNLKGIISKLSYIKSLGVDCIYLTPVFKSPSSNRYDIEDFEKIDEMVGTWEDLQELHEKANNLDIAIVIDVVFNHSSSTNKLLEQDLEMYDWINKYDEPKCWWGFTGLIEFNKNSENYYNHLARWLALYSKYVDGIRLDVADCLPDFTLKYIRQHFHKYILGEVWKNAVTGDHREFFYGDELDGVMNYRFANAIYHYIRWGNYKVFRKIVSNIYSLYPHEALAVSPIFLSSHDIPRIPNILVGEFMQSSENFENVWDMERSDYWFTDGKFDTFKFREWQYNFKFTESQKVLADKLQNLAVFMQYTLPGIPVIFAGDEAGVWGFKDPFNRKPFPWDNIDREKYSFYCKMGAFRNKYKEFFKDNSNFELLKVNENTAIYKRGKLVMVVNRTEKQVKIEGINLSNKIFALNGVCDDAQSVPPYGAFVVVE